MNESIELTALRISNAIKRQEITCAEVVEHFLERISLENKKINAVITVNEEEARLKAIETDEAIKSGECTQGILYGVPFTVKDIILTAGVRTTFGLKSRTNFIPNRDAEVISRLKASGAILLGKTNVPNKNDIQCNNIFFGRTKNPWNLDYTSGGSSGGGAAAVMAGLSPLDIGSDLGGSLRIPAHCCGIYALKPTENRVPSSPPRRIRSMRHMLVTGALAGSVEDLRLALSVMESPVPFETGFMDWEVPPQIREQHVNKDIEEYRIAWTDNLGVYIGIQTKNLLKDLSEKIRDLGCYVEYTELEELNIHNCLETFAEIATTETLSGKSLLIRIVSKVVGLIPKSIFSKYPMLKGYIQGSRQNLYKYTEALTRRDYLSADMDRVLSKWDILICPVAPGPAFKHQKTGKPIIVDGRKISYWAWGCSCTGIFSVSGNPVVVIPIGKINGLPVGIQLVGRRWTDNKLLNIAELLSNQINKLDELTARDKSKE